MDIIFTSITHETIFDFINTKGKHEKQPVEDSLMGILRQA